jgi:hypothetical protein
MHKSMLGWPILLLAASCVPPMAARELAIGTPLKASAPGAAPGFQTLSVPIATEAPPPLEKLAEVIAPGAAAKPFELGSASEGDRQTALNCLTTAVYHEARSETEGGQRAVAQVVLNRVRHPAYPNTVCGVVYQGSNRSTGCQFSFTCDGSLARGREPGAWERARKVAAEALAGYVYEPVGVATHYHTTAIRPWWAASLSRAVTIGSHIFYRWRGEWGDPRSFRRPYVGAEAVARAGTAKPGSSEGPSGKVETAAGVTVHRGVEPAVVLASTGDGAAVRVHRSGAAPALAAGVRVHRGAGAAETPDAEQTPALSRSEAEPVAVR